MTVASDGTVAAPFFDHALYMEARMIADGRLVHELPSKMMFYVGTFENAAHYGWNAERVAKVEEAATAIRKMIHDTRMLKLLHQMRSSGYDC